MAWLRAVTLIGFALLLSAPADSRAPLDGAIGIACADCVSEQKAADHETSCSACMSAAGLIALPAAPAALRAASPEARYVPPRRARILTPEPAPPESADIV